MAVPQRRQFHFDVFHFDVGVRGRMFEAVEKNW
jgi:hypothetical protein